MPWAMRAAAARPRSRRPTRHCRANAQRCATFIQAMQIEKRMVDIKNDEFTIDDGKQSDQTPRTQESLDGERAH
jgi:hypothetical protein